MSSRPRHSTSSPFATAAVIAHRRSGPHPTGVVGTSAPRQAALQPVWIAQHRDPHRLHRGWRLPPRLRRPSTDPSVTFRGSCRLQSARLDKRSRRPTTTASGTTWSLHLQAAWTPKSGARNAHAPARRLDHDGRREAGRGPATNGGGHQRELDPMPQQGCAPGRPAKKMDVRLRPGPSSRARGVLTLRQTVRRWPPPALRAEATAPTASAAAGSGAAPAG